MNKNVARDRLDIAWAAWRGLSQNEQRQFLDRLREHHHLEMARRRGDAGEVITSRAALADLAISAADLGA